MKKKAVILTSGGLDSTTCLAIALSEGYECYTLAFDYGQKHRAELIAAAEISRLFGAKEHKIFTLEQLHGSALTDRNLEVPDYKATSEIPITYVPARNTIFIAIAMGWAEVLKAYDIFIGVSAVDYSHYPDCRPDYIDTFQRLMNLSTKEATEGRHCKLHTPLIHLSKAETIHLGLSLGVDYRQTVSCYRANEKGEACGRCASCMLRKKGFHEANLPDPTQYS